MPFMSAPPQLKILAPWGREPMSVLFIAVLPDPGTIAQWMAPEWLNKLDATWKLSLYMALRATIGNLLEQAWKLKHLALPV